MKPNKSTAIDVVEAAYDLEADGSDWLSNVVAHGAPLFDLGLGFYAASLGGVSEDGQALVTEVRSDHRSDDLPLRFFQVAQEVGPDLVSKWGAAIVSAGIVAVSELQEQFPEVFDAFIRALRCKKSSMRKLGVETQAQLVEKMRGIPMASNGLTKNDGDLA